MKLGEIIKDKPDLYIPIWTINTLIFCFFAFGNISGSKVLNGYNYTVIGTAVFLLYGYLFIISGIVYFLLKLRNSSGELIQVM